MSLPVPGFLGTLFILCGVVAAEVASALLAIDIPRYGALGFLLIIYYVARYLGQDEKEKSG